MPGTPLPARRSRSSTGALRSIANKENSKPQDELNSPGDIMSKEKRASRVNRRISVLKILGRTEAEISPCAEPELEKSDAGAKRRRASRVSFGNIQTAIFQKDSEWNNTPSPAPNTANQGNNLSALPDDSGFASPAATEQSCVDMSLTGGFTNRTQPLSSLPPVDDMFQNDTSLASFGEPEASPPAPARTGGEGFAVSLADLVAEDEREWASKAAQNQQTNKAGMEFRNSNQEMDKLVDTELEGPPQKLADVTDHDLTKDIPAPGYRTRALADHTGAFLPVSRRNSDVTGGGMELTNAYGGIVHVQRPAEDDAGEEEEGGMEFTAAYGGIVAERAAAKRRESTRGNTSADMVELSGTLSRIRKGEEAEAEAEAARDGMTEGVAMEMTGTFGRIISAISSGAPAEEGDGAAEEEDEDRTDPLLVGTEQRTYVDGEVTMFTPLSRIKRRASRQDPPEQPTLPSPDPEPQQQQAPAGSPLETSPPAMRTRSRSRTPTRAASEEAEGGHKQGAKRRKSAGGRAKEAQVSLEVFLEEMGIRFLTNAKTHTRKSSFCPPMRALDEHEPRVAEKLREVLVTGTELGQLHNNSSRLRALSAGLAEEVAGLEQQASTHNPQVVREGMREVAEGAVQVQAQMKALKKLCRVQSEIRWTAWREAAQREVEEALVRVKKAVGEDLAVLRERLEGAEEAKREEALLRADDKAGELKEQLARLREAEAEQQLMLSTFSSQLASLQSLRESLEQQLAAHRQPAPLPLHDDMLPVAVDTAPPAAALPDLAQTYEALQGLAAARPSQLAPGALSFALPAERTLSVSLSPGGTVTTAVLQDVGPQPRSEMEAALWEGAGCKTLVDGLVYPHGKKAAAVAAVVEEVALRSRRVAALQAELAELGRRHLVRAKAAGEGSRGAHVEVVATNAKKGFKVALSFDLAWHYPCGRLPYTSQVLAGEVEENLVADTALRFCSGPRRISNIVRELCSA